MFGASRKKCNVKRSDTGKTFLDFDEINSILPPEQKLDSERFSRGVYRSADGSLMSISNSKVYSKGCLSWYYVYADRYADIGVKNLLFTIGLIGVIVVPMAEFQAYKKGCYWKEGLKRGEKRYRVDIIKKENKFFFVNSSSTYQRYLDVSNYFIPFTKNEK